MKEITLDETFQVVPIGKRGERYKFPAVCVDPEYKRLYFNPFAAPILDKWTGYKFLTSTSIIAIVPANIADPEGASMTHCKRTRRTLNLPVGLAGKMIAPGWYRLYKYRDGVAFKRYEPLGRGAEEEPA